MAQGSALAAAAVAAAGADADGHLRVDLRPERVELSVQDRKAGHVTTRDAELAHRIAAAVAGLGLAAVRQHLGRVAAAGADAGDGDRRDRHPGDPAVLESGARLRRRAGRGRPVRTRSSIRPGSCPPLWFQQMDAPRPQRNRVHFDITVAHDEAEPRVRAALAAGGRLVDDSHARAFWVLADAEGNEVCVCTWTDRDEREE